MRQVSTTSYRIDLTMCRQHAVASDGRCLTDTAMKREPPRYVGDLARWYFMGATDEWKPYDQTSNQRIETAHENGQTEVMISGGLLGGIEASKFELFGEDEDLDKPIMGNLPSVEWCAEEPWLQRVPLHVKSRLQTLHSGLCSVHWLLHLGLPREQRRWRKGSQARHVQSTSSA